MTMLNALPAVSFMKAAAEYWKMAEECSNWRARYKQTKLGSPTCSSLKSGLTQLLNLIEQIVVVGLVWQS